jgi:hypothetical protein
MNRCLWMRLVLVAGFLGVAGFGCYLWFAFESGGISRGSVFRIKKGMGPEEVGTIIGIPNGDYRIGQSPNASGSSVRMPASPQGPLGGSMMERRLFVGLSVLVGLAVLGFFAIQALLRPPPCPTPENFRRLRAGFALPRLRSWNGRIECARLRSEPPVKSFTKSTGPRAKTLDRVPNSQPGIGL